MTEHYCGLECGWEYGEPVPTCVGKLQKCIDDAYWELLSGIHDIDLGRPDLTYETVILAAMKTLNKCQLGVG